MQCSESFDLIKLVHQHKAVDEATMAGLLKAPKMRNHLDKRLPAVARLYSPLKKWADKVTR